MKNQIDESLNNKYHDIKENEELKIYKNFDNSNIFSNIFSNLSVFEKRDNIFNLNNKTYKLKYNNHINENNFYISYYEKKNDDFINISPWHHINLKNEDNTYNMVVEIPKYNYMKMEINLKDNFNIIKQDYKKGKLRYYYNAIYWNYGALPQTYEYPKHIYKCKTKQNKEYFFTGDNDPLDIIDIGMKPLKLGEIVPVKILGSFLLIDEGELDWKIICINKYDKYFNDINTLDDIEKYYPSNINILLSWFKSYKMSDTKKLNIISNNLYNKKESEKLIENAHKYYLEFLNDVKKKDNIESEETVKISDITNLSDNDFVDLMQDITITYYKVDSSYKPDTNIFIP